MKTCLAITREGGVEEGKGKAKAKERDGEEEEAKRDCNRMPKYNFGQSVALDHWHVPIP